MNDKCESESWRKRKWDVKKFFDLKEDFFLFVFDQISLSLRLSILLLFLSIFFVCLKKKFLFWSFRDVVCVKFSFDWFQHYQVWSIVVEVSQDCSREEFEIEMLSKMYQVSDREFFSQIRLWRESCRLQSLRTSQCCLHDCMNVDNLSMTCRWLIIADWFCVLCRLATNSRANHDCCHLRSEWRSSRRVNAQDAVSSKIDEAAKARTFEREEESLRRSTSTRSTREFHENFWRYRSLSDKCFDVFWSTTLIFLNRRFEAFDRAWYRWECVRCLRSFAQAFSRRHHDRFSSLCEEEASRQRSKSCLVENRIRLEFCREEEEESEKEEKNDEKNRERKKKRRKWRKKKRKWKWRNWQWWREERRRRRSSNADRCQQAAWNSDFCHHRQTIVSFRQEINNFVNKLRIDCFFYFFDVSLKSMIKSFVKKSLKRMHRRILVSSLTFIDAFIVLCWRLAQKFLNDFFDVAHIFFFDSFVVRMRIFESFD